MELSSLQFIFMFLPIFLLVYLFADFKYKNLVILIGSIIFYIIGVNSKITFILLTAISVLINYWLGLFVGKKKNSKLYLIIGILFNFGWLFVFKYFDFFSTMIANIIGVKPILLKLQQPVGISFFTFSVVSYLVDVYRAKIPVEKNFIKFSAYIMMFFKFTMGPITSYDQVKPFMDKKKNNIYNIELGIKYFAIGLGYKILIADRIGVVWGETKALGFDIISTPLAWLAVIAYSFKIYFDFHGLIMMSRGIGKMLGLDLPENFDHPYTSKSMTEFWRKWHMTLGTWFKKYIYFPLGGSRNGMAKMVFSSFVVWLFTGLWHGADWNYIIWGLGIFVVMMIEKFFLKKYLDKFSILGHIYMIILIPLSWAVFALTDLSQLGLLINKLFVFATNTVNAGDYMKFITNYWYLFVAAILCCTKLPTIIYNKNKSKLLENIFVIAIFWLSIYFLCTAGSDPGMYYNNF